MSSLILTGVQAGLVKRTFCAQCDLFAAAGFGKLDYLGVVIVVKGDIFGEILHEQPADLIICFVALQETYALEYASGVGINHETGS